MPPGARGHGPPGRSRRWACASAGSTWSSSAGEDGRYLVLEANLRPPGATMTDMMNYACDSDVYRLWARMLTGEDVRGFNYKPKYHVCHTARRTGRPYRHQHSEVVARLGDTLLQHRALPSVFTSALGDEMYLTRHPDLEAMREAMTFIQART